MIQVVALITDYGTKDAYVAELKANLLSRCKDIYLLDIMHTIEIHDIGSAAFHLANFVPSLPQGSIVIAAVNNYYKLNSEYMVFEKDGIYYIGPNNGLFTILFEDLNLAFKIDGKNIASKSAQEYYAHAAACINHGLPLEEIGPPLKDIDRKISFRPVVTNSLIRATIIHIDHYENVMTNVTKETFEKARNGRNFAIYYKPYDPIDHIHRHYADVAVGEVVCFFNHAGYLELAINMGKASSMLNLNKNETIQIDFF